MKKTLALIMMVLTFATSTAANAVEPLVDKEWVKENLGKPSVVFLDVRNKQDYVIGHIPGAVHTTYSNWRVNKDGVPDMLPDNYKSYLEELIGGLGIDNKTHVVIVPNGRYSGEVAVATHIYWTFKFLGHEKTSILNGGMTTYLTGKKYPIARRDYKRKSKTYVANIRPELLATTEDVKKAIDSGALIDNRSKDQHLGITKSSMVKHAGTIPGATNMPTSDFTLYGGGTFLKPRSIQNVYEQAGVTTKGETINFCNTGLMAAFGWFVSHELLGNKEAKMYDGSMAEWTSNDTNPVEVKVKK